MLAQVFLFPEQASTVAPRVDANYWFLVGVSTFFTVLIASLLVFFAVKYRRRSEAFRPRPIIGSTNLELIWTFIPLGIVMFNFFWSAHIYTEMATPPEDTMEVFVVGRQWMWYSQHLGGQRENRNLTVPVNRAVRLTLTSQDVIHDFAVPEFRLRVDVFPNRYTHMWFKATKPGKYHLFCAEYCGTNHSRMVGWVNVLPQHEFQEWLNSAKVDNSMATEGRKLFLQLECQTCHSNDSKARGPNLENLYESKVPLKDGSYVNADDRYIQESIWKPNEKIVAGFQPIMPSYQGQVTTPQMLQLIAYIRSLKKGDTIPRVEDRDPPAQTGSNGKKD